MKNDKLKFGVINWSDNGVMEKKGEKKESNPIGASSSMDHSGKTVGPIE